MICHNMLSLKASNNYWHKTCFLQQEVTKSKATSPLDEKIKTITGSAPRTPCYVICHQVQF